LPFSSIVLNILFPKRLLIEAKKPHRVTYANAAFSHGMLGDQTNMHRWVEQQNSPESQQIHLRTLDSVIQDVFVNAPVVVYPVLGSGKVSHYLVEAVPTHVVPATTTTTTEGASSQTTKPTMILETTQQQKQQQHSSDLESFLSQTVG
jgi:hypothetical protein